MKLYEYQKELVNKKSDKILVNWCEESKAIETILHYILINKPSTVLSVLDILSHIHLIKMLEKLKDEYDVEIDRNVEKQITRIVYNGRIVTTIYEDYSPAQSTKVDLLLSTQYLPAYMDAVEFKKHIHVTKFNVHKNERIFKKYKDYTYSMIDYKALVKEDILTIEDVIEKAVLEGDTFYQDYALNDRPLKEKVHFSEFKEEAIQRLQKQFLDIKDSKDTVLTRKNIIEMIKDLKEIN